MTDPSFRPLAVGSPRSGFVLLCSILNHFVPLAPPKLNLRQRVLNALIDAFGDHIANEVSRVIAEAGLEERMVYSPAFRKMTGGPKWLHKENPETACYRKYVGIRGLGDFTLITSHPRQTLDYDEIVHCHVDASRWLREPAYAGYQRFASVRNPIGIVNSSLFSINALTSEYIQKFVPPEDDTHAMRERLALFKFTNLDFFEGLVKFYRQWFDEFIPVRDGYTVMRWEDLLTNPRETIARLAAAIDLPVDSDHAGQIWDLLSHANLTGAHKHNFRRGGGVVGDWKRWITNQHLEILRGHGFDEVLATFGYEPITALDESRYSPFQREVAALLAAGKVYDDYPDRDLFGFAFNKSNMDSSKFPFKRYGWRRATQIERADMKNEDLIMACWTAADEATLRLNAVFEAALAEPFEDETGSLAALARLQGATATHFAERMPKACAAIFPTLEGIVRDWYQARRNGRVAVGAAPRLIRSVGTNNIISHEGQFLTIPQSSGPIDLSRTAAQDIPGASAHQSYRAAFSKAQASLPAATTPSSQRPRGILSALLGRLGK